MSTAGAARRNLALIGYRGTGKSTVAREVALRLGWDWIDADVELERRAGRTIQAIFASAGEEAFRDLEQQVVADLTARERWVLALGGGAILRTANRAAIRAGCWTAWLTAAPDTLLARIREDATTAARRPPLTTAGEREEIEQLLAVRAPLYRECADCIVATDDRSPESIAAEVVACLGPRLVLTK
jgi:shikimate kinase